MSDIDLVRRYADIVRVIGGYVNLRKRGKRYVRLCPFHHEKTPSFTVSPDRQSWKCFGCGAGGDVFSFIQRIEGVDFPRSLAIVADLAGVSLTGKPWTLEQRREYHEQQAERGLLDHFLCVEGYPDRNCSSATAALRAACKADPGFRAWLADDLQQAERITAVIVAMLAAAQERDAAIPQADVAA